MKDGHVRGWLALPIVAALLVAVPWPTWGIEQFYAREAYPWLQGGLTGFSNVFPLALVDLMLLGAAVLLLWRTARLLKAARETGVLGAAWEGLRRLIRAAAVLTILFLWVWGFNYRRAPLEPATPASPSADELRLVVAEAAALAARLRPPAAAADLEFDALAVTMPEPFNAALRRLGREPLETVGRPKFSIVLTPFFTWTGVNGMVNPLVLETIVHPDLLPYERPFVLAHEWAHLAGHADEAEANAVGWLAAMHGGPPAAYSACLFLVLEAGGAMPGAAWKAILERIDAGVRADLAAIAERTTRQRPAVRRAAFRVYDHYLRANSVEDGVASYSRSLELILSPEWRGVLTVYGRPGSGR